MPAVEFQIEFTPASLEQWTGFAEQLDTLAIARELDLVHRKTVLQILRSVILLSPVDTGRFRAAWTVWMRDQGLPWKQLIEDSRLMKRTSSGGTVKSAIADGLAEGSYRESPFDVTLINNVAYGIHLENRFKMVQQVMAWGERRQEANFTAYWESLVRRAEEGDPSVVPSPPTDVEEGEVIG